MNLKTQVVQKLNAIVELVRHCATKVVPTQDPTLMQEVTLAAVTHEGLCKLFEQNGPTENVINLVNDFGNAVAELYRNIDNFKPAKPPLKVTQFTSKRPDKNLLN
jgi:hypothetical protein